MLTKVVFFFVERRPFGLSTCNSSKIIFNMFSVGIPMKERVSPRVS